MASRADFLEIEHKFLVGDDFDVEAFRHMGLAHGPRRTTELRVRDTYFVTALDPRVVFRHRVDAERQELTCKSRGGGDAEVRTEINLRLDPASGDQGAAVEAFLAMFGVVWKGTITKDILVFYYPDCEVVFYRAEAGGEVVRCVEFEATGGLDVAGSREALAAWEARFGFAGAERVQASLFELLLAPRMPPQPA